MPHARSRPRGRPCSWPSSTTACSRRRASRSSTPPMSGGTCGTSNATACPPCTGTSSSRAVPDPTHRRLLPLTTSLTSSQTTYEGHTMLLDRIYDQDLSQASYFSGCQQPNDAIVIDPRRDVQVYLDMAEANGMRIAHVTETHIHADN